MPVVEERTNALATAAAAAAAGAAVYGLRKALSSNGVRAPLRHGGDEGDNGDDGETGVNSLLATLWDSASGSLLPMAEQAAEAAGRWVAESAPEVVRCRIIPRFIEAFEDAA